MSAMNSLPAPYVPQARASRATTWALVACVSIAVPMLFARQMSPLLSFFYQSLSLFGWGGLLAVMANALPARSIPLGLDLKLFLAGLLVLLAATLAAPWWTGQPVSLAFIASVMIAAAALAAVIGAALQRTGSGPEAFRVLCIGLLAAATANACVAIAQIYAPGWIDGYWIALAGGGRATGNLRQSNHLCALLLWGIVASVWLGETRVLPKAPAGLIALFLLFAVVLTGARWGVAAVVLFTIWGVLDRRLSRHARIALLFAPVVYALLWAVAAGLAEQANVAFDSERRFSAAGAIVTSRFDVWANTLELIRAHPWIGVGPGEFNIAWTLTEFPKRTLEYFTHAHNLPLHFAVELGLPLATLVLSLLGRAFWAAARNFRMSLNCPDDGSPTRAAFVMLSLILLHSMLEYPLWYVYFLLPSSFMLGLCLAWSSHTNGVTAETGRSPGAPTSNLRAAALLLMLGAAFSVLEYLRVTPIFIAPPPHLASPLSERIAAGQRSLLFPFVADMAAVVESTDPADAVSAAHRAAHMLLIVKIMMPYANALHATGDTERARYVAQRLKEFPSAESQEYFAPCEDTSLTAAHRPYQCFAPQRKFTFEDFR